MKKTFQRLLTFFIGVPLLFTITWFCTYQNHLLLNSIIVIASVIASIEMRRILSQNFARQPLLLVAFLSFAVSLSALVCTTFGLRNEYIVFVFIACLLCILIYEVFGKKDDTAQPFKKSVERIFSSLFIVLYTAFLLSFIQRMGSWQYAKENITVFLLMVFLCDSFAWLFGITMGKNNRGFVKVSPNKSIVGFIGGFIGSVAVGVLAQKLLPYAFPSLSKTVVLSLITALASILGDLSESVIKRSTDTKDSGFIIPGRGGLVDSIDSIVMAAPVYYIMSLVLFQYV